MNRRNVFQESIKIRLARVLAIYVLLDLFASERAKIVHPDVFLAILANSKVVLSLLSFAQLVPTVL